MILLKAFIFFLILFPQQILSNNNDISDSTKTEFIEQPVPVYPLKFQLLNTDKPNKYNLNFKKQVIILPDKLSHKNYILFNLPFSLKIDVPEQRESLKEQFAHFQTSLYNSLALEYKKFTKYDLGEVGRYLGISGKVFTIILWLLSIFKH